MRLLGNMWRLWQFWRICQNGIYIFAKFSSPVARLQRTMCTWQFELLAYSIVVPPPHQPSPPPPQSFAPSTILRQAQHKQDNGSGTARSIQGPGDGSASATPPQGGSDGFIKRARTIRVNNLLAARQSEAAPCLYSMGVIRRKDANQSLSPGLNQPLILFNHS